MKKFEQARGYALKAVNALFDGLIEVAKVVTDKQPPTTSAADAKKPKERVRSTPPLATPQPAVANGGKNPSNVVSGIEFAKALKAAIAPSRRTAPSKMDRIITPLDREIVMTVFKGKKSGHEWRKLSERLQANLGLTRQQVAGILADDTLKRNQANAAAKPN